MHSNNRILEEVLKNRFNYCHVLEVDSLYELQSIIDNLYDGWINEGAYGIQYSHNEVVDFLGSLEIYCLEEEEEEEVYEFNITNYLNETYGR